MLKKIKEQLIIFANGHGIKNVDYGVTRVKEKEAWNYIVFKRNKSKMSESKNSLSGVYNVYLVMENYIPEDFVSQLVETLSEIKGFHLSSDITFNSYRKGNSDLSVEVALFEFTKAKKGR